MINVKNSQRGQSLVECLLLFVTTSLLIKTALLLFLLVTHKIWIKHQLYQSLVCVAKEKKENICKKELIKNVKQLSQIGKIKNIKIINKDRQAKGYLKWEVHRLNLKIHSRFYLP